LRDDFACRRFRFNHFSAEGAGCLAWAGSLAITRDEPQNQWVIHPVIDGCDSGDDNGPPPVIK